MNQDPIGCPNGNLSMSKDLARKDLSTYGCICKGILSVLANGKCASQGARNKKWVDLLHF
ncbi:MAG: hypothetical protein QXS29_10455 [Nitrososphaeria archaeon]